MEWVTRLTQLLMSLPLAKLPEAKRGDKHTLRVPEILITGVDIEMSPRLFVMSLARN